MSRSIQVRVSESLVRTIHVEDGVQSQLEMLPILAPERMGDLLGRQLEELGFQRTGGTCKRVDPDGMEIEIDLATATVSVRLGSESTVGKSIQLTENADMLHAAQREQALRERAARSLEQQLDAAAETLRREVTAQLERKLGDLKRELDGAVGRATVAALTERAAQLGHIEESHQDEAGNVTIRVRL